MSSIQQEVKTAALRLRNASPEGWDKFLTAFSAYTDSFVLAVTEASADRILVQQGHAQSCLSLQRLFAECTAEAKPKPAP